jgi:hypothetical protein
MHVRTRQPAPLTDYWLVFVGGGGLCRGVHVDGSFADELSRRVELAVQRRELLNQNLAFVGRQKQANALVHRERLESHPDMDTWRNSSMVAKGELREAKRQVGRMLMLHRCLTVAKGTASVPISRLVPVLDLDSPFRRSLGRFLF